MGETFGALERAWGGPDFQEEALLEEVHQRCSVYPGVAAWGGSGDLAYCWLSVLSLSLSHPSAC